MQNKGIVRFLAVCFALVCAFYLSFNFVTRHYDKLAQEYAKGDAAKEFYYLDSLSTKKVWFGYTLKECREKELNRGLDLKGGMNVTMEVSVPDILLSLSDNNTSDAFQNAMATAKERQKESSVDFVTLFIQAFTEVDPDARLASVFATYELRDKVTLGSTNAEVEKVVREEVEGAIDNSFNVLRTRIDRFGVVQPNIQKLSQSGRILIELPGIKEPERVRKLLQGSANLEFWTTYDMNDNITYPGFQKINNELAKIADANKNIASDKTNKAELDNEGDIEALLNDSVEESLQETSMGPLFDKLDTRYARGPVVGRVLFSDTARVREMLSSPIAKQVLKHDMRLGWTVKPVDSLGVYYELVALQAQGNGRAALEGDVITDAKADFSQFSAYANVSMSMNAEGAKAWQRITKDNIGKSIAIVLDGYVYSYPTVQNEIAGGNSQITGNFTVEEAKDLANTLKSGKMPAPARIIQEDVVGPSLGEEAIHAGLISFIFGFILILIYMILYYGIIPGLIADAALLCNITLLMGILSSFSAVLTLPGIAGIVLTMGMAVDANVLIFERIREEKKAGKQLRKAIDDGFKGAISAIVDANVTSFLTGAILAIFGTGPIKGFAVTYMIGIVSSFLTAVFLTRLWLSAYAKRENAADLSFTTPLMKNFLQSVRVDWVGKLRLWFIIAGVFCVIGVIGFIPNAFGKLNLGIDFTGGRNYIVRFAQPVNEEEVKAAVTDAFNANKEGNEKEAPSVIRIGKDNQVRISTNYRIKETGDNIDEEIEAIIYNGCKPFLAEDITLEQFKSTEINPEVGIMQSQKVGPSIAKDIRNSAIIAIICALIGIFLYILLRFRNLAYSVGSVVALAHDTILVLGVYAICSNLLPFSMEIDLAFIAAVLTVIGYSINNTVVIFDRLREFISLYSKRDKKVNINDAINKTLSRTFSTTMSTLVVLLAIFFFGGESIRGFVFALLIGMVVGSFSSLCVAPSIAYIIQKTQDKKRGIKVADEAI